MPPPPNSRPIVFTEIEQFGGAERAALALARWLSARNLETHIVAYDDRSNLPSHASFPLEVIQLKPTGGPLAKIHALHKYFANRPPSAPRPLLSGYQPALHATLAGLRGFHTLMHDTPFLFDPSGSPSIRRRLSNRIIGHGLRSGGTTIVTSEFLRDECRRDFRVHAEIVRMGGLPPTFVPPDPPDSRKGRVSHPANTTEDEARALAPEGMSQPHGARHTLHMLSVSRIEPNKRLDWLLDALAELDRTTVAPLSAPLSQLVDWHFDIAGQGPQLEPLRAQAKQLRLSDHIHFHGFVPDVGLETLCAAADLFLMPAIQGYGIPAIESLNRGIPVFLHRDSGVSEILLDTPWAHVMEDAKPNTAAALARSIAGVLDQTHLAAALPTLPTENTWAEQVARICAWSS